MRKIEFYEEVSSTNKETGFHLGKIVMPDNLELGLFYYKINTGSVVAKRVELRQLVHTFSKYMFDAVLAVFDDGTNWRVSFISDIRGEATAPKRFTYVFGDADSFYHTATSRFLKLQTDGVSFKTLMEAFSVETLTKEFYNELFAWYQWALSEEVGVTYPGANVSKLWANFNSFIMWLLSFSILE